MRSSRTVHFKTSKPKYFRRNGKIISLILFVFLLSIFFLIKIFEPKLFPINHLEISSENEEINSVEAKKMVEKKIRGFFLTDMMDIKKHLSTLPNVDQINLKRVWPDKLIINITTQKLVAKWGKQCAVTSKGEIVSRALSEEDAPWFNGPQDQSLCMLQKYQVMSDQLKGLGLKITKLELNDRRSWQLALDNGVHIMLGRKDVDNRFLRFMNVWPKLNKLHQGNIATIDLRYANGVSVCPLNAKTVNGAPD